MPKKAATHAASNEEQCDRSLEQTRNGHEMAGDRTNFAQTIQ
jgi:hypothetical protein